jgi:hypothetical protein
MPWKAKRYRPDSNDAGGSSCSDGDGWRPRRFCKLLAPVTPAGLLADTSRYVSTIVAAIVAAPSVPIARIAD